MQTEPDRILPLSDPSAVLAQVGGKGASLARLVAAGLPVPPGFHITTAAYRRLVAEHGLQEEILAAVCAATPDQPATLEEASNRIGQLVAQSAMPDGIAEAIRQAYGELGGGDTPVAVRSSATAEDLPEMSSAGLQETYLNMRGEAMVLDAIKRFWASLWTARAIAYRARRGIAPDAVAIAVVVQGLVFADAAGVMFTANPLTGQRDEIVINATWGLGEALVSGAVTPDTLTVEKATGTVIRRDTAEKQVMTVRTESGTGEAPVPDSQKKQAVLTDTQAAQPAELGVAIENLYEMPMDIEWALAAGKFAVVQARPITALLEAALREALVPEPPLEWAIPYPKPLLARGSSIDLLPDAMSPLFITLGVPILTEAFRRMYAEVMGLHGEDTPIFKVINGYVFICFPKLIKRKADPVAATFLLGLDNLPLRAEKSLFGLAQWAKAQPELADHLARTPPEQIWIELQADRLPAPAYSEFATRRAAHLEAYGHILYDIDFMNPIPAEEPVLLLDTVKAYLAGQGGDPRARQQAQESRRREAEQAIAGHLDPPRRKWFRKLLASARACAVERENAIANFGLATRRIRSGQVVTVD